MKGDIFNILKSGEFLVRLGVVIPILLGLLLPDPWKFLLLLLSGIVSGLYYGCYNDIIWRPNSVTRLSKEPHYRAHQMWIQIFCGLVGSIILYYLLFLFNPNNPSEAFEKYGFNLIILSFAVIMAYGGLLARLLWFMSYGLGQFGKPLGK